MIKISRGVYGFIDENGTVQPKTARDGAFSASEDEEARLVNLGVAEYVGEEPRKEEKPSEETPDETSEENTPGYVGEEPRKETPSEETSEETPEEDIPEIPDENPDEEPKAKKKPATKRR